MRSLIVAFLLAASAIPVAGQTATSPAQMVTDTVDNFRVLFRERETLINRQRDLQREMDALVPKLRDLPPVATLQQNLDRAKQDLRAAEARRDSERVTAIQSYITFNQNNLALANDSTAALAAKHVEYDRNARQLFGLEQRIASLFDDSRDTNRFRLYVTITFGILVLLVIAGFYGIAWKKENVAATIFSGEMGMQFITLFLIVIAIILFGIMGTLEGKELAALLGGLSGYILGRASGGRIAAAAPVPAEH